jgi:hypothetical protein
MHSKEQITKHYQEVKNVITSSLKENNFESDKKDEFDFLQGIKKKLEDINETFKNEIEELEEIADWENLCISFFGETNAGKSTIIDTLRIIYNEESRLADIIENQNEVESFFNQNNETYSKLVCAINQFKSFTKEFYEYLQNEENQLKQRKSDLEKEYEELTKKHNTEYEQKVSEFQQEKQKEMLEIENKRKDLEKCNNECEQKLLKFEEYRDDYEKLKNFYKKKRFSVKTLFVIGISSGLFGAGVCFLLQYFM